MGVSTVEFNKVTSKQFDYCEYVYDLVGIFYAFQFEAKDFFL